MRVATSSSTRRLGGVAAWPIAAGAQQGERIRRIGVLIPYDETDSEAKARVAAFREGLEKLGWTLTQYKLSALVPSFGILCA